MKMMKMSLVMMMLIGGLVVLNACKTTEKKEEKKEPVEMKVFTEKDQTTPVTVALGEVFQIKLDANPTTGYQWSAPEVKGESIMVLKVEYRSKPNPDRMAGVGGYTWVTVRTLKAGDSSLMMNYRREWEKDDPIEKFKLDVVVE